MTTQAKKLELILSFGIVKDITWNCEDELANFKQGNKVYEWKSEYTDNEELPFLCYRQSVPSIKYFINNLYTLLTQ